MRVILADDAVVIRQGLARLLADHGLTVVAQVETGEDLLRGDRGARSGRRDRRHPHAAHLHRRGPSRRP